MLGIGINLWGNIKDPYGLSLDLQFATDKTLTARKGPTPVLTRASTATFIGSDGLIQSAAINQARFDHDPATPSVCRGLLLEEQRTNLLYPSSIAVPQLATQTRSLVSSTVYTLSFYGTGTVVVSGKATGAPYTIVGTGAYPSRRIFSFTAIGGNVTFTVSGIVQYAQLEQSSGGTASSFIQTTSGPLARSADVCSIIGADFTSFWNRFAGTCVVGVGSSGASVNGFANTFVCTSPSARTFAIFGSTAIYFAPPPPDFTGTIVASGATYPIKLGLAYAINDYQSSYSGLLGDSGTNTNGTIPDSTDLRIGYDNSGAFGTKHIQFVRYYKKRLPNAKLQAITA
jgi:hypothetical protein